MSIQTRTFFAALTLSSMMMAGGCTEDKETAYATLVGAAITNNVFTFYGEVDNTLVSSCGTAAAVTAAATTTTGTTSTSTTSTAPAPTKFKISSFYVFNNEIVDGVTIPQTATMLLKYTYNTKQDSFGLTPTSSSTSTCETRDFIKCETGGPFTCATTDSQTCGGESAFIFSNTLANPVITFEAYTGTIDWSRGFNLNSDSSAVSSLDLELRFVNKEGTAAFVGGVRCTSSEQ